jgi:hypothetical protein
VSIINIDLNHLFYIKRTKHTRLVSHVEQVSHARSSSVFPIIVIVMLPHCCTIIVNALFEHSVGPLEHNCET